MIEKELHSYSYKPLFPELILIFLTVMGLVAINYYQLDFLIADFIYNQTQWSLKQSFIVDGIFHKFAKIILAFIYVFLIYQLIFKIKEAIDHQGIFNLFILLLTIATSVLMVFISKRLFDVDCPWDLIAYGGDKPFFSIFHYDKAYLPSAQCFPAGHASVGFSWIAVYFYYVVRQHKARHKALVFALIMGFVFGFTQQLRGAHFISHDLWSLLICLVVAVSIYSFAYRKKKETGS